MAISVGEITLNTFYSAGPRLLHLDKEESNALAKDMLSNTMSVEING